MNKSIHAETTRKMKKEIVSKLNELEKKLNASKNEMETFQLLNENLPIIELVENNWIEHLADIQATEPDKSDETLKEVTVQIEKLNSLKKKIVEEMKTIYPKALRIQKAMINTFKLPKDTPELVLPEIQEL